MLRMSEVPLQVMQTSGENYYQAFYKGCEARACKFYTELRTP